MGLLYSMQAIQNLGLAVVPIVAGYIVDHNGYLMLEVFFLAMLSLALIAGMEYSVHNVSCDSMECWCRYCTVYFGLGIWR